MSREKIRIILDMDDTLYKNREFREKREQELLNFLGSKAEEYKKLRKSNGTLKSLGMLGISKEKFYEVINKIPINLEKDPPLAKMLENLKSKYSITILSNNSRKSVKETIDCLGISHLIDSYFGGDDFSSVKPSEEAFSIVNPGDICIGNNFEKDLRIPKNKGAKTILISKMPHLEADFTVPDIYSIELLIGTFS